MDSNIYVKLVDLSLTNQLKRDLLEQGFTITIPQHTLFAAKKKNISCTLYQSGKLVVQGKDKKEFIEFYLEPQILKEFTSFNSPTSTSLTSIQSVASNESFRIGIDESGKGDFFGPLCIAGVYAGGEGVRKLKEIGVRDSKLMTDSAVLSVAQLIRKNFVHEIVKINPAKYNELYDKFKNLNRLLAWGHATTIESLVERTSCRSIIIDQFAHEDVVATAVLRKKMDLSLIQRHRGEEDLVVAAASILAREAFLIGLRQLGEQIQMTLPKGGASSNIVKVGRQIYLKHGLEGLKFCGKIHFKTLDSIIK